jgi:hypothetical protein
VTEVALEAESLRGDKCKSFGENELSGGSDLAIRKMKHNLDRTDKGAVATANR